MRLSGVSRVWAVVCVLVMTACSMQPRKDPQHIEAQLNFATSENAICQAWLKQSDVYQRLNKTFILHDDHSDAENKMAMDRNASDAEKADLLRLNNLAAVCRKSNLENFGRIHPEFVALLAAWYAQDDALLVELLEDRLSIGRANQIVHTRLSARQTESQTVGAIITEQLETSDQAESANRQPATDALQQWNREQQRVLQYRQRISPDDTTRLTNCSYSRDGIGCTTY